VERLTAHPRGLWKAACAAFNIPLAKIKNGTNDTEEVLRVSAADSWLISAKI